MPARIQSALAGDQGKYFRSMVSPRSTEEIHVLFQEAFNRGDLETLASLYESDAILMVGGQPVVGRANIRAIFRSLVGAGIRMSLTTHVVMKSPEGLAFLQGEWVVRRTEATATESSRRDISAEVVRK